MRRVFEMRGTGWGVRRLTANGQPALAAYAPEPGGGHRLHTLQVFTVTGGRVARSLAELQVRWPSAQGQFQPGGQPFQGLGMVTQVAGGSRRSQRMSASGASAPSPPMSKDPDPFSRTLWCTP
jgi:hypothetical protein